MKDSKRESLHGIYTDGMKKMAAELSALRLKTAEQERQITRIKDMIVEDPNQPIKNAKHVLE